MPNEVLIEFKADTQGLENAATILQKLGKISADDAAVISRLAAQNTKNLTEPPKQAAASYEKLNKDIKDVGQTLATKVVLDKSKDVLKTSESVKSLKQQIREAINETARLTEQFGALDKRTQAAAQKAANLREHLDDVNKSISALNPEAKFNAFIQVAGVAQGAMAGLQGAMGLFGDQTEETKKILEKFQYGLNFLQGLNSLMGMKDALTNLKLVLGITTVATNVQTAALEGEAVAATEATVATEGFTAALMSNPITIAVIAIAALGVAYLALKDDTEQASNAINELNDEIAFQADVAKSRARLDKENQESIQGEIDLLKAKGATTDEVFNKEKQLREQRVTDLQAEKNRMIRDGSDPYGADVNAIRAEIRNAQNEVKVLEAQFNTDRLNEQKKFNEDRLKAQRDFLNKMRDLDISLSEDPQRKASLQAITQFEREQDTLADSLDKKLISLAQYNEGVVKLQQDLDKKLKDVSMSGVSGIDGSKSNTSGIVTRSTTSVTDKLSDDTKDKIKQLKEEIITTFVNGFTDIVSSSIQSAIDSQISGLEQLRDNQDAALDERLQKNKDAYDNELISARTFRAEEKKLLDQKTANEVAAQKKINDLKKQAAISAKLEKLFEIAINTASNIVKNPALALYYGALGALEAGVVAATPLPKYHTGRLAKGQAKEELAIIREDETITNPQKSKDYAPVLAAIHNGSIPAFKLNDFVKSFSVKDVSHGTVVNIDPDKFGSSVGWHTRGQESLLKKILYQLKTQERPDYRGMRN